MVLVLACALLAGGIAQPARSATYFSVDAWSEVVLDRGSRAGLERSGLVAKSVDGRSGNDRGTIRLQPGVHTLVLQWNPKGTFSRSAGHVLRVDAKPCKRYYVVARFPFSSSASATSWQPQVHKVEDIIGCTPAAAAPDAARARPAAPPRRPPEYE